MTEDVLVPGGRDVRATLDHPTSESCVVGCPPHPQMGGRRTDARLRAVSDALADDASCLRFDYGPWDEGYGELEDARAALSWARDEYETVAIFGYSFGGCIALLAAARESENGTPPEAASALAPVSSLGTNLDAAAELGIITCPGQILYGERDTTADWEQVVDRARGLGWDVDGVSADHHFVGQADRVGEQVADFMQKTLR